MWIFDNHMVVDNLLYDSDFLASIGVSLLSKAIERIISVGTKSPKKPNKVRTVCMFYGNLLSKLIILPQLLIRQPLTGYVKRQGS